MLAQVAAAEPALPGPWVRPPWGLRPDTNGLPFVPAEGLGLRPSAACKERRRRFGAVT